MSSLVHNRAVDLLVQEPSMRGRGAEARREHRPPGPAANPRRSPRFRVLSVALVLESSDEGGAESVLELYDVGSVGDVLIAGEVLRVLRGGGDWKYEVAKQNPQDESHLGIYDSNYPPLLLLQPSRNSRLFRDCQQLTLGKQPALRYLKNLRRLQMSQKSCLRS